MQYSVCTEHVQNKTHSKFRESTKFGKFCLSQGLTFELLSGHPKLALSNNKRQKCRDLQMETE